MAAPLQILYLHGFASGPGSRKAQMLREAFPQARVLVPALDGGDFAHLRLAGMLARARAALADLAQGQPLVVVGSSLGGWVANQVVRRRRACRVVLLAPALDLPRLLPALATREARQHWRSQGSLPVWHAPSQAQMPLHAAFLQDLERAGPARPLAALPGALVHGRSDAVVPWEHSWRVVRMARQWSFHLLDADHALDDAASLRLLRALVQAG